MKISLNNVVGDIVLSNTIYDPKTGAKILEKGSILNPKNRERLKRFKIEYIETEQQDDTMVDTINDYLKDMTVEALSKFQKEIFNNIETANLSELMDNSKNIVMSVNNSNNFNYNFDDYFHKEDTNSRLVRIASFAINIAKIYNYKASAAFNERLQSVSMEKLKEEFNLFKESLINLDDIAIASMLHEIGTLCEDNKVVFDCLKEKKNAIEMLKREYPGVNDSMFEEYNKDYSSVYSYLLLQDKKEISPNVKKMILFSNEGEIQNKGILQVQNEYLAQKKNYILAAKIIHLCDIYDQNLKQTIEQNCPLEEVVSALDFYEANGYISKNFFDILIDSIPFYPYGAKVLLSSGEEAVVTEPHLGRAYITRPTLRLVKGMKEIDLRYIYNITIRSILQNIKYYDEKKLFQDITDDQILAIKKMSSSDDPQEGSRRKQLYHARSIYKQ